MGCYRITTIGRANKTLKGAWFDLFFWSGAVHGKALKLEVCNVDDGNFHVEVEVADAGVTSGAGNERNCGG